MFCHLNFIDMTSRNNTSGKSSTTSKSNPLTGKTIERLTNAELLKSEGIIIDTEPEYCDKKKPGTAGKAARYLTNFFGLKPTNTSGVRVFQYDIEIAKVLDSGKTIVLNKARETTKKNDYFEQEERRKLVALWPAFQEVLRKYNIARAESSITDFKRILYLLDSIHLQFVSEDAPKEPFTLELERSEFPSNLTNSDLLNGVAKLEYKLSYTTDFDSMESIFSDNLSENEGIQYLALLSSMKVSLQNKDIAVFEDGKQYLNDPLKFGFRDTDIPELHGGKRLGIGSKKTVKLVSGNGKDAGIALAIDTKRTAFHDPILLSQKFEALLSTPRGMNKFVGANAKKVIDNMKGLACHCIHLKNQTIIVSDVSAESATKKAIEVDGKKSTVADYYKKKYNITLKHPDYPLIVQKKIFKGVKQQCFYPMELLKIAKYQRVKQNAQTPEQISQMIRQCATAPQKRLSEIHNLFSVLQLIGNEYLKEANFAVEKTCISTMGRQLKAPTIVLGNNKTMEINNENGSWEMARNSSFNTPSSIQNWCCVLLQSNPRFDLNKRTAEDFIKRYVQYGKQCGIKMSDCAEICECPTNEGELKNLFDYMKGYNTEFALFMTPDNVTNLHNLIKLYERKYGIATQDLKHSTVKKIIEKNQIRTLGNIILKSNVKKGGLNYDLKNVVKADRLIIGIGFNHTMSGDTDALSVVGYAANTRKITTDFAGDVLYTQFTRDGQISFYEKLIQNTVKNFKSSRNMTPKEVIIYRTSGSEGKYNDYCIYEIPYVKAKLKQYAPGCKLTFVVVEKGHNFRLFKEKINSNDKAPSQNVAPGAVVDTGITNPKLCEFFLSSHSGLQGTVKVPKYVVLYDDLNLSMDELEGLTNSLAYGYQVVTLPVSIPAPVYIANSYAERGRNILNANNHNIGQKNIIIDEVSANEKLSYVSTAFNNIRINA